MVIEFVRRAQEAQVFLRMAAIELRRLAEEDPAIAAELRRVAQELEVRRRIWLAAMPNDRRASDLKNAPCREEDSCFTLSK